MQRASELIGSRQPTGAPYASIPWRYPRTVTQAFRAGPDSSQQHQLMFNAFAGAEDRVAAHGDHDVGTCRIWPIPPPRWPQARRSASLSHKGLTRPASGKPELGLPTPVPAMAWEELRQLEGIRRQAAGAGLVAYAFDHPDYYPSHDAVEKAFGELLARTPQGLRVFACGNSARGTSGDRCP